MNIIWVIREICADEGGFESLFDKEKSYGKLLTLSDNKQEAAQLATLLYGRARESLFELIHDAYHYQVYEKRICDELMDDGMSEEEARRTIEIFYETFGFPNYRNVDILRVDIIVTDDGTFRTEYKGEVRNGKEHGVGVRNCYYDGKWCSCDECVWVDGVMCGYDNAREMEFGMFEDKKIGFVVNNYLIGKTRIIPAGDNEAFDDVGKRLNIQ